MSFLEVPLRMVRNWKFSSKFGGVTALLLLPLCIAIWQLDSQSSTNLARTDTEYKTIKVYQRLVSLIAHAQDHRLASDDVMRGDPDGPALRQDAESSIEIDLRDLTSNLVGLTKDDPAWEGVNRRLEAARNEWPTLRASFSSADDSFTKHSAWINELSQLSNSLYLKSHLATDEDERTYHAALVVFRQVPQLSEDLAQSQAMVVRALSNHEISPENKAALRTNIEHLRRAAAELTEEVHAIAQTDPGAKDRIEALAAEFEVTKRFASVVERTVLNAETITMAPAPVSSLATKVVKTVESTFGILLPYMQDQLAQRAHAQFMHRVTLLSLAGACLTLAFLMLILVYRSTHEDLQIANTQMMSLAQGDLSQCFRTLGKDEFAELTQRIDTSRGAIALVISGMRNLGQRIDEALSEICKGNSSLHQRTMGMATDVDVAASLVDELAQNICNTSDSMRKVDEMALAASGTAKNAGEEVARVSETMRQIHDSSKRIGEITSVIDSIAFQTNILALNAAVEAARAGDHGRGFAVVASEVRLLATRTLEAAKEIHQLIASSQAQATQGLSRSASAGTAMETLVGESQQVCQVIAGIVAGAAIQKSQTLDIQPRVVVLREYARQNSNLVQHVSTASQALAEQADELVRTVATFKLPVNLPQPSRL